METVIVLAIIIVVGGTVQRLIAANRQKDLRNVAQTAGLTDIASSGAWFRGQVTGTAGGKLSVSMADSTHRRRRSTTITIVDSQGGLNGVSLAPETAGTALQKQLGAREIQIGDDAFDAEFFVDGQPATARALLDVETRQILRTLLPWARIEIVKGTLRAVVHGGLRSDSERALPSVLATLLDVAGRLTSGSNTAERLSHNALEDPLPPVRLQNLLVLLREFWGPSTRETLREACGDVAPEVRLYAASALGANGLPVLLELAHDPKLDDALQAEAVTTLGRRLALEQAEAILTLSLRSRRVWTAAACLHVLGGHGAAATGVLQKVLAVESDFLAAAAARALGDTRAPAAEARLVAALESDGSETRCAAADALGRVGSAEAVLPLKEAARRYPHDRGLERTTRQAVAEIQSRQAGASPGQLSLAATGGGQVSLAPAEAGRLSFPVSEAGQLSLPAAEAGQLSLEEPCRDAPQSGARGPSQR